MYCAKCGKEINDEAVVCIHCGCAVGNKKATVQKAEDAPNAGFALLGFFIPLVGLILYLTWKDTLPLRAKSAGKGALIGFCTGILVSILSMIASCILMESLFGFLEDSLSYSYY